MGAPLEREVLTESDGDERQGPDPQLVLPCWWSQPFSPLQILQGHENKAALTWADELLLLWLPWPLFNKAERLNCESSNRLPIRVGWGKDDAGAKTTLCLPS